MQRDVLLASKGHHPQRFKVCQPFTGQRPCMCAQLLSSLLRGIICIFQLVDVVTWKIFNGSDCIVCFVAHARAVVMDLKALKMSI